MGVVSVVAAVLLGAAFLLAGGSKLAAGPAWPQMAADLGAPRFSVPVLPWIELAVGALLVAQAVEPWPAIVALALLLAFGVLIGWRMAEGKRPSCACFGAWSASPIGWRHLSRNLVLAVLAVLSLWN